VDFTIGVPISYSVFKDHSVIRQTAAVSLTVSISPTKMSPLPDSTSNLHYRLKAAPDLLGHFITAP